MRHSPDRRRTIWVVDDSPMDAERVRRLLALTHDVEILHDGAAALEHLAAGATPDLMVLDWVMPGISGIDVCHYVRSAGGRIPRIPILLLTACHGTQEILQAFRSGANDYVAKPFVDEELQARVESQLATQRLIERAEQAEADARSLLASAPDPILGVDAQGAVSFVNEEGARLLGDDSAQIAGTPIEHLIPGISLRNLGVAPGESLLPVPDVQVADRIYSPSIRVLPSDSAAATTIALRDVTARRQAEARRLDFYSIIAHDLRTPISTVLLRLDRAFSGVHGVLPTSLISDLRKMEGSLRSMVGIINDFLELASLEGVGYKIDRKPVDLSELVRSTMDDFQPLLHSSELAWKPIGLEPGTRALVHGDRERLAQVITNLVSNAIKFTPVGGELTISLITTDDHVEVSVEDTGRGIARDELPTLFERFTRAQVSAREVAGTGLGLMIVREIVEAHGGVVGVESEPGVGSRFWFRLPRQRS